MTHVLNQFPQQLNGQIQVPGDKSISHRALILGAVANGRTTITNLLQAEDTRSTLTALQDLGTQIEQKGTQTIVTGQGGFTFRAQQTTLQMNNAGTATRLLLGLLVRQPQALTLIGDQSLSQRPMQRVLAPLNQMRQQVADNETVHLPIIIQANQQLEPLDYQLPVASAQVKSALMLAAIQAPGTSHITEIAQTRDHTERLLRQFGGQVTTTGLQHTLTGPQQLTGTDVIVPGDFSAAAFWLTAGLLVPNSRINLPQVGVNPTRTGFLTVLALMGATIEQTQLSGPKFSEPFADLSVETQALTGIEVPATLIPNVIDELPLVALLGTQASGQTIVRHAAELRVKETDRIRAIVIELRKLGASIEELPDGFIVTGPTVLHKTSQVPLNSHGDHRIAMMLEIASLLTPDTLQLEATDAIAISYPNFENDLQGLIN